MTRAISSSLLALLGGVIESSRPEEAGGGAGGSGDKERTGESGPEAVGEAVELDVVGARVETSVAMSWADSAFFITRNTAQSLGGV